MTEHELAAVAYIGNFVYPNVDGVLRAAVATTVSEGVFDVVDCYVSTVVFHTVASFVPSRYTWGDHR